MVALPVLVSGLEAEMIRLGYKESTMTWYHGAWRRLQRYFSARGVEEFSLVVAMEWVDEACGGFFAKEQAAWKAPCERPATRPAGHQAPSLTSPNSAASEHGLPVTTARRKSCQSRLKITVCPAPSGRLSPNTSAMGESPVGSGTRRSSIPAPPQPSF
jgi:hypothetical protein